MDSKRIRKEAKALDEAIERGRIAEIVPFFSNNCHIEIFGLELKGKNGLLKALLWMTKHLSDIKLTPIVIMVRRETFFEEFVVEAKTPNGNEIKMKQAEVLEYDSDYKVKSLRLYFDRLILAKESASNVFERWLVRLLVKSSTKGLE
jgi:hypothetical protein